MGRTIGIDLGTTNTVMAVVGQEKKPEVIITRDHDRSIPSVVTRYRDNFLVGQSARNIARGNPVNYIFSIKRLMGRRISDPEVERVRQHVPYRIVAPPEDPNADDVRVLIGNVGYSPVQISAEILKRVKADAELKLGETVTHAVITVPAYFDDNQKNATREAGRQAGLKVRKILDEPSAAALAFGLNLDVDDERTIIVYDLGGGTFDISILKLHEGIFEVLATNGDTHLGGDDIDNKMLRIALEDIQSEWSEDISHSGEAVQTLRRDVIRAKEALSFAPSAKIEFAWKGKRYEREISRELFENLIRDIVDRTLGPCRACMADAGVTPEQIDEVVLVGGSTRIPLVRSAVEVLFRAKPHTELNPDEVVALGAAVQAGILSGAVENQLLLDVTPLSLGIETYGGVVSKIIHRNSTIPASAGETFTTGVDGQTNVLIHVVQGERELAKDCRSLARFDLKGIDPMPAGMARIEVRFLIDADGILNVTARDARTGKEHSVDVKPSYGLTDEQVEAMIEASIDHAEEDYRLAQVAEARVAADRILAAVDKAKQNEAWSELSGEERDRITSALNRLLLAYHSEDPGVIRAHIETLELATRSLAETMMNAAVRGALKGTKV